MLFNHLILCCPLLLLPSISPTIRVFSNESPLPIRWPEYWNFSLSICPSNEHSGLIPFKIDWFDLLAVEGTLKSLFQHHSLKASILRCSASFYCPALASIHDYRKNQSFNSTDLSWLSNVSAFNMILGLVIAFLSRRKCLLISWLLSLSTVILESKKIKPVMIFVFLIVEF